MEGRSRIFSVGHSNHEMQRFIDLLRKHGVEAIADVRSSPWSRYAVQFNREHLRQALEDAGISYVFLGEELGGRPEGDEYYDDQGHVLYGAVAASPLFATGLARLEKGTERLRVAMMCSEEDPADCHRRLLITRVLEERGTHVVHIRGDGRTQTETEIADPADAQESLFGREEGAWRSTRSVSRRRPHATSSVD